MSSQQPNQPGSIAVTVVGAILVAAILLGAYIFAQRGMVSQPTQVSANGSATPAASWPTIGPTFTPLVPATPIATITALPTATPLPLPVWTELNNLVVLRYPLQTVAEAQAPPDQLRNLFGTDKVVIQVIGTVTIGIDLSQIRPEDIQRTGNKITVRLPKPTVQEVAVDPGRSQIVAAGQRWGFSQYQGLEKEALERGRVQLWDAAINQTEMIDMAGEIARLRFTERLQSLGFADVTVTIKQQ
jgi:hypothetical protein